MSLTSSAVRRPVTTVAAVLALVLVGTVSLSRLPVALLPDVVLPVLTIRTDYAGAAATEVSRFVAEPIEEALAATPGLVDLRSISRNERVTTLARFAWGTDMAATVLNVRERLDNVRSLLPERATRPTLLTSDPGERPIAVLGLTGPGSLRSIARIAEEIHARRLEQLEGVASVAVVGAPLDEIRVDVDPNRMRALGLSPADVASAIRAANATAQGGTIRRGQFRYSVRALTELRTVEEIAETPIGPPGSRTLLRDIATVRLASADPETLTRLDGEPAVGLVVYKDAGANTVAVTGDIYGAIELLADEFPEVRMSVVAAQAEFVTDALANLAREIFIGGALALLVILLFLGDLRSSLAIGLIVPLSVLIALVLLQALDVTINILSLGGLALGVGLLVDNAIVVTEASGRYRAAGFGAADATRSATEEVSGPLIAGTLTTMLVFGPIVFVRGLAAALFRDLSLSVVVSLGASLILALTLLPVVLAGRRGGRRGWRGQRGQEHAADRQASRARVVLNNFGGWFGDWYEHGVTWSLHHPAVVFAAGLGALVMFTAIAIGLPREILPQVDEGMVVAQLTLPEGTTIEETTRQTARLETLARDLGSSGIYSRVGEATDEELLGGAEPGGANTAQIIAPVPAGMAAGDFAERLRLGVPDLAQGALALDLAGQSEFGSLIGREGRAIRVEISAGRLEQAERWAETVRRRLAQLPTLVDARLAYAGSQPVIEVEFQRDEIAQHGVSLEAVAEAIAGGLGGVEASELRETDRRTPITVRLAGAANEDLASALTTQINGIPVGRFVTVRDVRAPVEVVRSNQRPVSVVEAVVEEGGTARATRDIEAALATLPTPPGVTWKLTGADIEQRRTLSEFGVVAFLSVALVFLVLAGEFASFTTPLVVMLTVPLAAGGGIMLLWLTGQSINAVSLMGLIVIIGIADNDAVVKLAAINRFRAEGHAIKEAILLGGRQRLRPVVMTSLTTIAGVLPLVIGLGSGGQLYRPLAASVIGGAVTALVVTFFLMPTAYFVVERAKEAKAGAARAAMAVIEGGER
ncbi:MAG: efflux RND transporter permease subunit [Gemmatimonadetes bacterium]|nr:MAG: efflux RND transporter permease subunit [Gemmatimonadota bacterium]